MKYKSNKNQFSQRKKKTTKTHLLIRKHFQFQKYTNLPNPIPVSYRIPNLSSDIRSTISFFLSFFSGMMHFFFLPVQTLGIISVSFLINDMQLVSSWFSEPYTRPTWHLHKPFMTTYTDSHEENISEGSFRDWSGFKALSHLNVKVTS